MIKWQLDDEGDWLLEIDGKYIGLVCPHCSRFQTPVAVKDGEPFLADTTEGAKAILLDLGKKFPPEYL